MKEVDAAIARYLAGEAERLRRRTDRMTALLLWGADLPRGGPFPDAFTTDARPAAPANTGNANRQRRRRNAAKSRH